jgi:hypothetical protein
MAAAIAIGKIKDRIESMRAKYLATLSPDDSDLI